MSARARTTQELIHWLEMGGGRRWVLMGARAFCGRGLSLVVAWRQFHGAASEATLVQADMGSQLASGQGFTTRVNYPQAAAYLGARGVRFDPAVPYPEVYQAPLYPLVIAGALRLVPHSLRESLFGAVPAPFLAKFKPELGTTYGGPLFQGIL